MKSSNKPTKKYSYEGFLEIVPIILKLLALWNLLPELWSKIMSASIITQSILILITTE